MALLRSQHQLAEQLAVSVLAALSASLASAFLFFTDVIPSGSLVLGVIWALVVTSLDAAFTLAYGVRSVLGALLGAGLGRGCVELARLLVGSDARRTHVATALAFPLSFVCGLAEDSLNTPLSFLIRQDVARLVLYAVAAFEADEVQMASAFALGSCAGYAVTLLAVLAFPRQAGSVARMDAALTEFSGAAVHAFEGMVAFLTSGPDHRAEAARRLRQLDAALEEVYSRRKSLELAAWRATSAECDELVETLTLMPSQLLALAHTLDARYERAQTLALWLQVAPALGELAATISMTLRSGGVEHALIPSLSDKLYKQLVHALAAARLDVAGVDAAGEDGAGEGEERRLVFAVVAVVRFARLANRFARLRSLWRENSSRRGGNFRLNAVWSRVWTLVCNLGNRQAWSQYGGANLAADLGFPVKLAVIDQIAIQLLVLWQLRAPSHLSANAFWAAVPLFFCLLPSFGGSLVKGVRRILGTALGGALAVVTALVSNHDDVAALILQLFVIGIFSKLTSQIAVVGYAGLVVFVTWAIVALANFDAALALTVDRLALTVLGSAATALLGGVVRPRLAMRKHVISVSRLLASCADLATAGVTAAISDRAVIEAASPIPAPELVHQYNAAAGFSANKRLRKEENARRATVADADGEAKFFSVFRCSRRATTLRTSYMRARRATRQLQDLENASLVFFATAASTLFDASVRDFLMDEECTEFLKKFAHDVSSSCVEIQQYLASDDRKLPQPIAKRKYHLPRIDETQIQWTLEGGLPRLYALLFTLEDFREVWNQLIAALAQE